MDSEKPRLIKVGDELVFLVLTQRAGSDFTFYLRNDEDEIVHQFLRTASGERQGSAHASDSAETVTKTDDPGALAGADKAKDKSRSPRYNYSCRVHILNPLLDKKDLLADPSNEKQLILLQRLSAAQTEATRQTRYSLLKQKLLDDCKAIPSDKLEDKDLIKTLIAALNKLLWGNELSKLFNNWSRITLTEEEQGILAQVADKKSETLLSDYFKFCALFREEIKPLASRLKVGRVLAGLSYEGKIWSLSFRKQEDDSGYEPATETDGNLNSIEELCQSLYEEIFYAVSSQSETVVAKGEEDQEQVAYKSYRERIDAHREKKLVEISGLVVIAGSTNSAKSLVTRGLIHLYLENVNQYQKPKRLPHLVTTEDPVERYLAQVKYTPEGAHPQLSIAMCAAEKNLDYTPRQQGTDSGTLQEALRDALRQTPQIFFVGETRAKKDWQELIDFASTGHLVITTAHAGSLVEAMHKIFVATKATTPAARSEVASRLLAVVHLKRTEIVGYEYGVLVPALWRRVPSGLNALTAEGLASILPHSSSEEKDPCSCLGRKYFVENLVELAANRPPSDKEEFGQALRLQAIEWDLQGA
jgi:hypothetical protein